MTSPSIFEVASAIAAVVSAVGGAFAAVAAFRSAASAREATQRAEDADRRALLREVSSAAAAIQAAVLGASSRGQELLAEYSSAERLGSAEEAPALGKLRESTQVVIDKARSFVEDAQLFSGGARALEHAPFEEIERVRLRLTEHLTLIYVIRDELDRKYIDMSTRNLQVREILLQKIAR